VISFLKLFTKRFPILIDIIGRRMIMGTFSQEENKLIWQFSGETLVIDSWGKNSLRVRTQEN